jgi:tRNA-dihydrouridine synthase
VRWVFEHTGCAAVMLARGALGNPWLFEQVLGERDGEPERAGDGHADGAAERDRAGAVLAGCRAWAWATDGRWRSKSEAARWAADRLDDPRPVHKALALRSDPDAPELTDADRHVVLRRARVALSEPGSS